MDIKTFRCKSRWCWIQINVIKFFRNIKKRGLKDPKLFVTDDFNEIVNVIYSVYPNANVQKCTIHKVRNAVNIAPKNQKQKMKTELKYMFSAESKDDVLKRFANFKKNFETLSKFLMRLSLHKNDTVLKLKVSSMSIYKCLSLYKNSTVLKQHLRLLETWFSLSLHKNGTILKLKQYGYIMGFGLSLHKNGTVLKPSKKCCICCLSLSLHKNGTVLKLYSNNKCPFSSLSLHKNGTVLKQCW